MKFKTKSITLQEHLKKHNPYLYPSANELPNRVIRNDFSIIEIFGRDPDVLNKLPSLQVNY